MDGRPVWLASVSKRSKNGRIIGTERWGNGVRRAAIDIAHRTLGELGEPTMERGFLMCATLCFHRGASDEEIAALPHGPGGLAGPPFDQVIYETEQCPPAGVSFTPCDKRTYRPLGRNGLRLPVDECGECESCQARNKIMERTS